MTAIVISRKTITTIIYKAILLLFLSAATIVCKAESYPAYCRVTTTLNVRSGPGKGYAKIGKLHKNEEIVINSVTQNSSTQWGEIDFNGRTGYVATQYVVYKNPVYKEPAPASQNVSQRHRFLSQDVWDVIKKILFVLFVIFCLVFHAQILEFLITVAIFAGIGALITKFFVNDAGVGAIIGAVIVFLLKLKMIVDSLGSDYTSFFEFLYKITTFPFWLLNRMQLILMEPWRYLTKGNPSDGVRSFFHPLLYPAEIILYILITPLRLINAIWYNMFAYGLLELYDLFMETLQPSQEDEGRGNILKWIVWFPLRLIKYPVFRGSLVLIEGAIWTVMDIFIPTITLYHGTDLTAAQHIAGNEWEKGMSRKRTDGTFCSSRNGWAGAGAYFGSAISTAKTYAYDSYRLSDNNPVMIVCRVSLGKILNYGLAPRYVHNNAGEGGKHSLITDYAKKHGYITGEWWNRYGYWEYCMHDWQNAYNYPWRIRPIYVYNFRTGLVQHIDGGFRHWLFSEMVLRDIFKSTRFVCLLIFATLLVIWLAVEGWYILWNEYLWYYFL